MAATCFLLLLLLLQVILLVLLPLPTATAVEQVMIPNDVLYPGYFLGLDRTARYLRFRMKDDCDLVLFDNGNPIWKSNTARWGTGCRAEFTAAGQLVIKKDGRQIWSQSPVPSPLDKYVLVLQPDGKVVIYSRPIWATRLSMAVEQSSAPTTTVWSSEQVMLPNNVLNTGDYLGLDRTARSLRFRMKDDCNLVLTDNGIVLWSSNTAGRGSGCSATLTSAGRLVIKDRRGVQVWGSSTQRLPNAYVLVLQADAKVVIYNRPVFSTGARSITSGVTTHEGEGGLGGDHKAIHMVTDEA